MSNRDRLVYLFSITLSIAAIAISVGCIKNASITYENSAKKVQDDRNRLYQREDSIDAIAIQYTHIGDIYKSHGDNDKAFEYYQKAFGVRNAEISFLLHSNN